MKIVITGVHHAASAWALAEWYIAHGHTVAGCGRSGPAIFDFRFTHPEPNSFDAVDVTQPVKVALWAERVLGALGRAGPSDQQRGKRHQHPGASLENFAGRDRQARWSGSTLSASSTSCWAFAPAMIERGSGTIVNLSSGSGAEASRPEVAPYNATKWAVEKGLTKALAQELPPGMAPPSR